MISADLERTKPVLAVGVCVLAFLILLSYALARPGIESAYLTSHGSAALPTAWLTVSVATLVAVGICNHFLARAPLTVVFFWALIASGLVFSALRIATPNKAMSLCLYVWKDVYIVVLLELLWSVANVVFSVRRARFMYGFFCAAGSLGGISGNLAAGWFSRAYGTHTVLWFVLPALILSTGVLKSLSSLAPMAAPSEHRTAEPLYRRLRIVFRRRYIAWILLLIVIVQITLALIDFRFNALVEEQFANEDQRTSFLASVYAAIDGTALVLQFLSAPLLRFAGVSAVLVAIPTLLFAGLVIHGVVGASVQSMALVKVGFKSMDYSLFRAAKEILYIPLSYTEKTQGKAAIDMLAYRAAKGFASLGLLWLGVTASEVILSVACFLVLSWTVTTWAIVREFRRLVHDPN